MKAKLRKTYNITVRLLIFIIAVYFLYDQIFHKRDIMSVFETFKSWTGKKHFFFNLSVIIVFIFINLGLEAEKWRYLISKLEKISFWNAYKAVLTGISVSIFLPNRTGDYLGRVFILKKADRFQAVLSTILGSLAQLITTILFGIIAITGLFPYYYDLSENLYFWMFVGLILVDIILVFIIVFAYVEFSSFSNILKSITGVEYKRIKKYAKVFSWYSVRDLFRVLIISILRYLIFSFQFYLLLRVFEVPVNYFHAMLLIGMVYLIMTIIPTVALSELGVRGSVSVYVFQSWIEKQGLWSVDVSTGVLTASSSLWFFNLAFPALMGTIFIFSLKFFRK
jgi:uncharacterized membrane protein YbhN (UPF0104 family)